MRLLISQAEKGDKVLHPGDTSEPPQHYWPLPRLIGKVSMVAFIRETSLTENSMKDSSTNGLTRGCLAIRTLARKLSSIFDDILRNRSDFSWTEKTQNE